MRGALLIALALLLTGCGNPRRSEPIAGPLEERGGRLDEGKRLFDQHCDSCHAGGEGGLGPALNDKPLPRFLMRFQIRHGLGTMPAFDEQRISDEQMEALLDYLIALRHHGG